jgi:hypothetical protein
MLEVLIIGGSVTSGGGVGNDPALAWHAFLGPSARPTVHFKNAIDPSYFLHCTGRFVEHDHYDAVLLDLGANMYHAACEEYLVDLIARVRCLSKAPSIAVINWPGLVKTNDSSGAAWRARATLIEVPHGPEFYSTDRVHPNARGHAGIAARVRAYLARPPRDAGYAPNHDCRPVSEEVCYPSATDMPVVRDVAGNPHGWTLVDDSPAPHLLHKRGWATATPNATLTLTIPPIKTCGSIVKLAYLASNFTGPFRVMCEAGCACSPIRFYHQRTAFPFPVVTGHEDCIVGTMLGNCKSLKVTRETNFNLLRRRAAPCRVTVTALTSRRVRLDGLYVEQPSIEYTEFARTSPPSTVAQRHFGRLALNTSCF